MPRFDCNRDRFLPCLKSGKGDSHECEQQDGIDETPEQRTFVLEAHLHVERHMREKPLHVLVPQRFPRQLQEYIIQCRELTVKGCVIYLVSFEFFEQCGKMLPRRR